MNKIIDIVLNEFKKNKVVVPVLLIALSFAVKDQSVKHFLYSAIYNDVITYETLHIIFQIIVRMLAVALVLQFFLSGIYYYKAHEYYNQNDATDNLPSNILKFASLSSQLRRCVVGFFYIIWALILLLSLSSLYTNVFKLLPLSIAKPFIMFSLLASLPHIIYKCKIALEKETYF